MIYHMHVYFVRGTDSERRAKQLRELFIHSPFDHLVVGRMHPNPVGPHTTGMFQVVVDDSLHFDWVIQFLLKNRSGLSVLMHANTGDEMADHTENCFWFGIPVPLDLSGL